MKKLLTLAAALLILMSAAAETRTATFTVNPQMTCSNCENKIKSNLRFEKGIQSIDASAQRQTVIVSYDSDKTNVSNIVAGFKKIGYTATEASSATKASSPCATCKERANGGCAKAKAEGRCAKDKAAKAQATEAQNSGSKCTGCKSKAEGQGGCCKSKSENQSGCTGCKSKTESQSGCTGCKSKTESQSGCCKK